MMGKEQIADAAAEEKKPRKARNLWHRRSSSWPAISNLISGNHFLRRKPSPSAPARSMNLPFLLVFLSLVLSSFSGAVAQPAQFSDSQPEVSLALRPSVAILIGVFSIVFSLSFILLVYAKFCHTMEGVPPGIDPENELQNHFNGLLAARARFSGIDKRVIESLPFFRFSSLKGPRDGLECAVCLSKFEEDQILRLLPKCKHAFHIGCIDRWLESHSSCPLCRCKVEVEDATLFKYSTSSRFLFPSTPPSEQGDDHGIYVERVPSEQAFTCRKSFRKIEKEETLLPEAESGLHKHMHRIILSDVVFKNRWSDLQSSDFISLKSEMLAAVSSRRFNDGGEQQSERKSGRIDWNGSESASCSNGNSNLFSSTSKSTIPLDGRCASEIINISRFADGANRRLGPGENYDSRDEKMRRLWVPIAKHTVQLFAGREKRHRKSEFLV